MTLYGFFSRFDHICGMLEAGIIDLPKAQDLLKTLGSDAITYRLSYVEDEFNQHLVRLAGVDELDDSEDMRDVGC